MADEEVEEEEEGEAEPEEVLCMDCNGSGEGMYGGTICRTCRGVGSYVIKGDDDGEDTESY